MTSPNFKSHGTFETHELRLAKSGDAGRLAALAERTFREAFGAANKPENMDAFCANAYGEAIQAREIADPTIETWVCATGEHLIAFLQLRWTDAQAFLAAGAPVEIQRFYVDSRWHGQGLAQDLMRVAVRRARSRAAEKIWLGVWEKNPRAIAFYAKCGFQEVGEQIFQLGDDEQRDVVMVRPA